MTKGCGTSDGCFGVDFACKQGKRNLTFLYPCDMWVDYLRQQLLLDFHILQSKVGLRNERGRWATRVSSVTNNVPVN